MELIVSASGVITSIYDETLDLGVIGRPQILRVSHVEPDDQGRWFAEIIDGPKLGPFARRSEAIAAEIEWLQLHRLRVLVESRDGPVVASDLRLPQISVSSQVPRRVAAAESRDCLIRVGQIVRLLPGYQDPGDGDIEFIAVDDEANGRVLVEIQVDLPIKPTQLVHSNMIDRDAVRRSP